MTVPFLDSNILLRHLTNDHLERGQACFALICDPEQGDRIVWTMELVVAEVVFVLSNRKSYGLDRETVRDLLLPLIELPRIRLPRKRLYRRVFDLYATLPIDYVDAYHAALMERRGSSQVLRYGSRFDLLEGTERVEP